jgi:urea-proton symporter
MLTPSIGYLVLFIFGVVFTGITVVIHRMDSKRHGNEMTAERFNTAGRSVGVGLASSSIVAAWTWAATIMISSSTGYQYGISGPFWYAAGAIGSILFLTMLFMAVTSAGSAELTAVTNILVTDVYRHSINPKADSKKLLNVSRWITLGFGLAMSVFSILLFYLGVSLGFVYMAMGIFVSSAVIPVALGLTWKRTTNGGAFYGTLLGMIGGIIIWVFSAYALTGDITIKSLGQLYPMLYGNLAVFIISGIISIGHSLKSSQEFNYASLKDKFKSFDKAAEI